MGNFFINTSVYLLGVLMGIAFFGSEQAAITMIFLSIAIVPAIVTLYQGRRIRARREKGLTYASRVVLTEEEIEYEEYDQAA